tara:strand:- start:275 stop:403 length:129 start_codon:yes stop_codon:yes gene_type:complete
MGEAIKYMNTLKFEENEMELIEEFENNLETPLGVGFAQKDFK